MEPFVNLADAFPSTGAGSMAGDVHGRESSADEGVRRRQERLMRPRTGIAAFATLMTTAGVLAAAAAGATAAHASTAAHDNGRPGGHRPATRLIPGDLLVSTSYYRNDPNIVAGTTQLPPGCTGANCVTAIANG